MALSGTFQNYPVSSFGLYCEWSGAQSVTGNYTDVTLKVYLSYYTLDVGARSDSTISINGVSETYTVPAIEDYSSGWKKKLLKTKTVRVSHNADGTKSGVALSASWRFSGTYSSVSIGTITASTTVTLNSIDRSAPCLLYTSRRSRRDFRRGHLRSGERSHGEALHHCAGHRGSHPCQSSCLVYTSRAGKWLSNEQSMIDAMEMAARIAQNRNRKNH